ncbi:MAG: DUF6562 domain-containing protein [Candidatus Egerieousia sp.]|nr:hypothetical protein [bacterium]MDY5255435.1 DUF6562 domain-containing protein [Candidatus Egerieousia sp.]
MKRFFNLMAMLALVALTFASCQKENVQDPSSQEADVTFTLSSPAMQTKAVFADGNTVNTVHVHVYKVDASGNLSYIAPTTGSPTKEVTMTGGSATYSARLVTGQKYTFVFWADYQADGYTSPYTYDAVNQTISVNYNAACNDEKRDAFYAVIPNVTITGAYSHSVTLKRPFAQVNFGVTTADYDAAVAAGVTVNGAAVKCTKAANAINLLNDTTSGEVDATFATATLPSETLTAANTSYKYVAMNYVLVGKDAKTLSDITLTLNATGAASGTPEYTYTNIPLQGNYRTNIVGELFTSPANINITVDKNFTQPDNNEIVTNVGSLAAANTALRNGATNIQISNVTSSEAGTTKLQMPATPESITVTIDEIDSGANLQIEKPASGSNPTSVAVNLPPTASVSQLTINLPDSHVEVNGAAYSSITAKTSNNTLVIGEDAQVTNLIIQAGAVEIYGKVERITNNGTGNIKVWAVGDKATFNQAYNAGAKTIELKNDIKDFTSVILIGRDLTLDGNGYEIWNTANRVVRITEQNLTVNFKNVSLISKSTASKDIRCVSFDNISSGANVVFDNCKLSASFYCINVASGPEGLNILIKNGTIVTGWAAINSYANNSTFTIENSVLKGINDKSEHSSNSFATIVFDGNGLFGAVNSGERGTGNTINITNSTIYAASTSSNNQAWISLQHGAQNNRVTVDAKTRMIDDTDNDQTKNIVVGKKLNPYATNTIIYDHESEIWIAGNNVFPGMYEQDGVYHIINAQGLTYFEQKVNNYGNSFSGKTVLLDADIDLQNQNWTPVGQTGATQFLGTFDGQGKTIKNLTVETVATGEHYSSGLFGWLNSATVKNLRITNATIAGHHNVGTIAGYLETSGCTIANCHVSDATISCKRANEAADGDKCGGIVGHAGNTGVLVKDCTVTNSSISAGRDAGQVVGAAPVVNVVNCSATNVTVTANGTSTGANIRNEVIGSVL